MVYNETIETEGRQMLAQRRYDMILEQVHMKKTVTVKELAQQLHVTEVTIRRDLETLDKKKMLKRVHGGAKELGTTSILSPTNETRMLDRLSVHYNQKLRVCQKAATYLHDGDCIFLDGGTSILPLLQCIEHLQIKIVTNNVLIEHAFEGALMLLFNPSTKENGGIFSQPQGWIILAESLMGHGNRAFEYFTESSPASMNDKAEIRKLEPYCHGQFTKSSESPFEGRAHVHWLTGTASTVMVGCVEGILGMRPDFDGLRIAPSVPSDWKEFEINKDFRGKKLHIVVNNPNGAESGFTSMVVNGKEKNDNYVSMSELADENEIILNM